MPLERAVPGGKLPGPQPLDRGDRRTRVVIVDDEEPKRASVRGELLDVEDRGPWRARFRGQQRVVREVLVVDRVELVLLDEADEVRDLDRQDAPGASRVRSAAVKSLRSGTCAKTLFATTTSAVPSRVTISRASPDGEELGECRDASRLRRRRDVPRRLDP